VKATVVTRYSGQDRGERSRYRGMAATVPAVPEAKGKYPLPQPVAITLIRDLFRDHLTQVVDQAILFSPVCQQEIP
jgi:hypothetical protein